MNSKVPRFGLNLWALLAGPVWLGGGLLLLPLTGASASSSIQTVVRHVRPPGSQFVFADLDGDCKPDLASVEMGTRGSAKANYSIQLEFSAGVRTAIGVSAPAGGLQVAARDVNGDDSVDLILTSSVDASFVEVLLNDGHGNFSLAAPGSYPNLENDARGQWFDSLGLVTEQNKVASLRSPFDDAGSALCRYQPVVSSDFFTSLKNPAALLRLSRLHLGRSPPNAVARS